MKLHCHFVLTGFRVFWLDTSYYSSMNTTSVPCNLLVFAEVHVFYSDSVSNRQTAYHRQKEVDEISCRLFKRLFYLDKRQVLVT